MSDRASSPSAMPNRRYLILVPLLMSVALVATVLASFASAREVQMTLVRGQGDAILDSIRRLPGTDRTNLAAFLAEASPDGLRCIAVFATNSVEVVGSCSSGGDGALRSALAASGPDEAIDLESRILMVRGSADDVGSPTARPPILVEFEPLMTRGLERSALRSLAIGGAASLALVVVAIGLWRLSLREARLQEAVERDRRLASLGEMAAVLAHEIRNPLASMKGHAQLLTERLEESSWERQKAERVVREAVRLEELTSDLLGFVRSKNVQRESTDPVEVLRAAADDVGAERIDLDCERSPGRWSLDPRLMRQVLANLLRNALQASPENGHASAGVAVEEDELVIEVRDRGEGIPAAELGRIFEPFHTTRLRGTGLGLAVARRIVALHGGTISSTNHPEGGAVFRVAIPRA